MFKVEITQQVQTRHFWVYKNNLKGLLYVAYLFTNSICPRQLYSEIRLLVHQLSTLSAHVVLALQLYERLWSSKTKGVKLG